jgi:hypothetical protein
VYAPRLWLTYAVNGWTYSAPVTDNIYSSGYGRAVRAVQAAVRAGTTTVLVDPRHPSAASINAGYNWGFFFGAIILGILGLFFTGFGVLFAVLWRRQGADHVVATSWPMPKGFAVVFCTVMGIFFTGGGVLGIYLVQRQRTIWQPVLARVDSTDVVWQSSRSSGSGRSSDLYAPRLWLTYSVGGQGYRAPLVGEVYTSNFKSEVRKAEEFKRAGTARVLVDPGDPYNVIFTPRNAVSALWLPAIFVIPGVVMFVVAAFIWRSGSIRRKAAHRRRRAVVAGASPISSNPSSQEQSLR